MSIYNVGDKIWYWPWPQYIFAFEATITEVMTEPGKFTQYCIDELVGHFLDESDFLDKIDVIMDMLYTIKTYGEYTYENGYVLTLDEYRRRKNEQFPNANYIYKEKFQGQHWLNIEDIMAIEKLLNDYKNK